MPYDPLLMAKMRTQAQQSAMRDDAEHSKPAGGGEEVAARNAAQVDALMDPDEEDEDEDEEVPPPPPPEEMPVVAPPRHRRSAPLAAGLDLGNLEKPEEEAIPPPPPTHRRGAHAPITAAMDLGNLEKPEEEAIPPPPPTHRRGGAISSVKDFGMTGRELGELAKPEEIPPPPPTHRRGAAIGGGFTPPRADVDFDSSNVKQDVMMGKMLRKEKLERNRELEALGSGKADTFRGHDQQGRDMRMIAEDPRFQKRYEMNRPEDQGSNAVSRKALEVKGKIMAAPDKLSNWWKNRKKKKKDDGAPSMKKKAGQYAARNLLQKVPVVGAGMKIAAGVKEHRRAKVDDEVAADKSQDDFTRAMGTGLATGHRGQRNKEFVGAAVSLVKTGVDVGTHGVSALMPDIDMPSMPSMPSFSVGGGGGSGNIGDKISGIASGTYDRGKHAVDAGIHKASDKIHEKLQPENLAETAGEQVAKRGGAKGVDKLEELLGDGEKLEPHKLRKAAIAPVAATPHVVDGGQAPKMLAAQQAGAAEQQSRNEAGVDKANDNLLKLTAADPKMGAAVLNHLHAADGLDQTPGMEGIAANLAQAREMDPATTKKVGRIGSRKTVETEHNLKPSKIAAMVRGDAARKRQAERMGGMDGTLGKLTNNEKRGWWEAGADTDVHVPKKEEDEAESEG